MFPGPKKLLLFFSLSHHARTFYLARSKVFPRPGQVFQSGFPYSHLRE
jgi:hypothetical protein